MQAFILSMPIVLWNATYEHGVYHFWVWTHKQCQDSLFRQDNRLEPKHAMDPCLYHGRDNKAITQISITHSLTDDMVIQ